ncbi:MAG: CDP-diacylglycerol--glycerol-3-phosphate 3-phosphatidyltransferase [Mycoplasmoidaceae bacterium]
MFKKSNIPNLLTIFRIVLVFPIIFFLFFSYSYKDSLIYDFSINKIHYGIHLYFLISGLLFFISSLTDFFDGYLSRKYLWVSDFGKIWDPIADKIVINSVLISFAILQKTIFFIPILIIIRDVIIDAYRMNAVSHNISISANIFGKIKTIFLFFGIILVYFIFNSDEKLPFFPLEWQYYILQNSFIILGTLFSILSGIFYIYKFVGKAK